MDETIIAIDDLLDRGFEVTFRPCFPSTNGFEIEINNPEGQYKDSSAYMRNIKHVPVFIELARMIKQFEYGFKVGNSE